MSSYVRNLLSYAAGTLGVAGAGPSVTGVETPTIDVVAPRNEDEDDAATVKGGESSEDEDEDAIPVFPALNSAQRLGSSRSATQTTVLTDAQRMPPPPLPANLASRRPGVPTSSNSLAVPSSSLAVPSNASSLGLPPSAAKPRPKKGNRKVALAPGHGPLDWANLQRSGKDLRGVRCLWSSLFLDC